jgi:hypothetical protein
MTTKQQGPGSATLEELRNYWRMPSLRATRELANRLGARRIGERYPWHSIWAAEGLAPPAPRLWAELKLPHMTTEDLAGILKGSPVCCAPRPATGRQAVQSAMGTYVDRPASRP